jgi:hypothetical protein
MSGYRYSQMEFYGVAKLGMTTGLMMNVETGAFESPKYLPGLQDGQTRTHLGRDCDSQLLCVSVALVRNWFAGFQHTLDVANDRVARHFESLFLIATKSNKAWKKRNRNLVYPWIFCASHQPATSPYAW